MSDFSVYSWTIVTDTIALKAIDKSALVHSGTGIPKELRKHFDIEITTYQQPTYVCLTLAGNDYEARFEVEKSELARTRLFWHKDFGHEIKKLIPQYVDIDLLAKEMRQRKMQ